MVASLFCIFLVVNKKIKIEFQQFTFQFNKKKLFSIQITLTLKLVPWSPNG